MDRVLSCERRWGFTLIELLIVVALLAILAAFVLPVMTNAEGTSRCESMASMTRHIRETINYHAGLGDVPVSAGGFPATVAAAWFPGGAMPPHAWSSDPLIINVVTGAASEIYPATKTVDLTVPGASTAWYNATNGEFVVLVPAQATNADTLVIFNCANITNATNLGQTTR